MFIQVKLLKGFQKILTYKIPDDFDGGSLVGKNISYENDVSVIYGVFNTFFGGLNGTSQPSHKASAFAKATSDRSAGKLNLLDNLSAPPYNVEFN